MDPVRSTEMRKWKLAFLLTMLGSTAAAESALQQFEKTLPQAAKFDFAAYQSCALTTGIDQKREGSKFDEVERAIASACKKHITAAVGAMRRAGVSDEEQSLLIATFSHLAFEERQLRFEGKAIPGLEPSPMARCLDTKSARSAIERCLVASLQTLRL